jgi:hypothetical protein
VSVHLGVDRKRISVSAHRLVLLAFVGPPPDGTEACHNNGIADDNRPENLRWDSHYANNQDRKRHGRYATGEQHHAYKFDAELAASIRSGAIPVALAMKVHGMSKTHYYRMKKALHK